MKMLGKTKTCSHDTRKAERRQLKRRERQAWKKEIR